nr:MAG TPA: hypothetical protein [Crassvirales sp.]
MARCFYRGCLPVVIPKLDYFTLGKDLHRILY